MWTPIRRWLPQSSFTAPVKPPTSEPTDNPLRCIEINEQYIPLIAGSMAQLMQPTTWDMTGATATLENVQARMTDAIAIVGAADLCTVRPVCAGVAIGGEPSMSIQTNSSGVWERINIGGGHTAGGTPIVWGAASIDNVQPGIYVVATDTAGVLHIGQTFPVPSDMVWIMTITVTGHNNLFHSGDDPHWSTLPDQLMYSDNAAATPIPNFPASDPIILPDPALIDYTEFHNPATPVGDYAGFYTLNLSPHLVLPFAVPAFAINIPYPGDINNQMSCCDTWAITYDNAGHPSISTLRPKAFALPITGPDVTYELGAYHAGIAGGVWVLQYGPSQFATYAGSGNYGGGGWASCRPTISYHLNMSSC